MSNNTSDFIGVSWDKTRKRWTPEIVYKEKKCHLGRFKTIEEAVYARFIAEEKLFKEYRNCNKDTDKQKLFEKITEIRKEEIKNYVIKKISEKFELSV
jgi:hypothetical protein